MPGIFLSTPDKEYTFKIVMLKPWIRIDRECRQSHPLETGGIMVGQYHGESAMLTEALPPPADSVLGAASFHRGTFGMKEILLERWNGWPRTHYIGEWHYHPSSVLSPSDEDLKTMRSISTDPRYDCAQPIMLIVGQAAKRKDRPVRAFVFPRGDGPIELGRDD